MDLLTLFQVAGVFFLSLILPFIISQLFFVRVIARAISFIALYQLKEYRFDRVIAHLTETREGKRLIQEFLYSKKSIVLWVLLLLIPFYSLSYITITWPYLLVAAAVFLIEIKDLFLEIKRRQVKRPIFTMKVVVILGVFIVAIAVAGAVFGPVSLPQNPIKLIIFDRLLPLVVSLVVFLISIPTFFAKKTLMLFAKRKISRMKNLTVIGVTGSYGKSSTKELVADFLSEKFNVLRTPRSVNTDFSIAKIILKELSDKHEIFVVEMGAYKKGEIAAICDMVKPKIGILTGINEQHLSLFGSLENTKKAKMELIESLPSNGVAFFNGDDPIAFDLSKHQKGESYIYTANPEVLSIKHLGGVRKLIPFLSNAAAAYVVGQKLGVSEKLLQEKLTKILPTLGLKTLKKGNVTILDDSFNSNPAGFKAALDVLATYTGKKILVTPGIIELGTQSYRIHKELAEKAGTICSTVILTNDNFEEPLREGLMKTKFEMKNLLIPKREELLLIVKNQLAGKTTLLLEGRMPAEISNFKFQISNFQ